MLGLLIVVAVGFVAQMIDGSLGMGYGVLSMSLLLATGLLPVVQGKEGAAAGDASTAGLVRHIHALRGAG